MTGFFHIPYFLLFNLWFYFCNFGLIQVREEAGRWEEGGMQRENKSTFRSPTCNPSGSVWLWARDQTISWRKSHRQNSRGSDRAAAERNVSVLLQWQSSALSSAGGLGCSSPRGAWAREFAPFFACKSDVTLLRRLRGCKELVRGLCRPCPLTGCLWECKGTDGRPFFREVRNTLRSLLPSGCCCLGWGWHGRWPEAPSCSSILPFLLRVRAMEKAGIFLRAPSEGTCSSLCSTTGLAGCECWGVS